MNNRSYPGSALFNQSLQARLQRKGPTIGVKNGCILGNVILFNVTTDKTVHCYPGSNNVWKCIQWGSGWGNNSGASSATFQILDASPRPNDMTVKIYATTRARYPDNSPCLENGSCDWDAIFSAPPEPNFANMSGNQQTFEYLFEGAKVNLWCDTTTYLSFANYILNPSPLSNILNLVELDVLNDTLSSTQTKSVSTSLLLHPDWNLAAWSVDTTTTNGSVGAVPGTRNSAIVFIAAMKRVQAGGDKDFLAFALLHIYTVSQAASMVTYSTTSMKEKAAKDAEKADATHQVLNNWASVQLWKFGTDSRTSKLGITVIIVGCLIVLVRTWVYIEENKSPTELVIEAVRYYRPDWHIDRESGLPLLVAVKEERPEVQRRRTSEFSFTYPNSPPKSP